MGEVRCTIEIPQCYGFGSERLFQPGNISRGSTVSKVSSASDQTIRSYL